MKKVLGIVNFESNYVKVRGIEDYRPISAASFLGRYRVVDFCISNFTNSGIQHLKVLIKNRPRSLVEHIHATNYNVNGKKGKIHLLYGEKEYTDQMYNTDIASLVANMEFIESEDAEYVVVAPAHFVYTQDFSEIVEFTREKGNDITVLYQPIDNADKEFLMGDVVVMDKNQKVERFTRQRGRIKDVNVSLETYCMKKDLFMDLVKKAEKTSSLYTLSNIISDVSRDLDVYGYKHKGFCACINSLQAYYDASMHLRDDKHLHGFIDEKWPIYTMTQDSCPTLFKVGGRAEASIVGNGSTIEGKVINSIISRNVTIKKGAVVKDSIVLPNAIIEEDAHIEYAIVDRFAKVSDIQEIIGKIDDPVYIKKGDRI